METVFMLFEGVCPRCGSAVEIVEVNGTRRFLAEELFSGDFASREWKGEPSMKGDSDGEVVFRCAQGHEHSVFHNVFGDWMV